MALLNPIRSDTTIHNIFRNSPDSNTAKPPNDFPLIHRSYRAFFEEMRFPNPWEIPRRYCSTTARLQRCLWFR